MITYAILTPGDNVVGYIDSALPPSLEDMADHLAAMSGFADRDALIDANPGLILGFAPIH